MVGEHLGFERSRHTTRRLRPHLERLRIAGALTSTKRLGREYWTLTPGGRCELERLRNEGRIGGLPESPQHRIWRYSRSAADKRFDEFRELALEAWEDAEEILTTLERPRTSDEIFNLGQRLWWSCWRLGSAIYCRQEWAEPDDLILDEDENPGPGPGRRSLVAWDAEVVGL